jgi:putative hydrolase of the HAD superfamily
MNRRLSKIFLDPSLKVIFIDGDDTLWYDGRYFRRLESCLLQLAVKNGRDWESSSKALTECLTRQAPGELGFIAAVQQVARDFVARDDLPELSVEIQRFKSHPIELLDHVADSLCRLSIFELNLLTKGSNEEQLWKLKKSGLASFFHDTIVVRKKNKNTLSEVFSSRGLAGGAVAVIGNSLVHDVEPALACGASGIWLNHEENQVGRNSLPGSDIVEVRGWSDIMVVVGNFSKRLLQ